MRGAPGHHFQFFETQRVSGITADYRRAPGRKIGRPSDFWISGRSRGSAATRSAGRQPGELENWNLQVRGATLTPGYADRMPFKFTGKLAKLTIELK